MHLLPDFDCESCSVRQQAERGCVSPSPIPMVFDKAEVRRCPRRVLHPSENNLTGISEIFWYYGRYKNGMLPESGGLNDQPAKLMQQFRVIDATMAEIEDEEHRTRQKQGNDHHRGRGDSRPAPRPATR